MWMATEMPATRRAVMTALTTPAVIVVAVHVSESYVLLSLNNVEVVRGLCDVSV